MQIQTFSFCPKCDKRMDMILVPEGATIKCTGCNRIYRKSFATTESGKRIINRKKNYKEDKT